MLLFSVDERIFKRFSAIVIISVLILVVFGYKLFDFQVANAEVLSAEADSKRELGFTIYGKRGTITDRNGIILAESITRYHLTVAPKHVRDYDMSGETVTVAEVAEQIVTITGEPYENVIAALTADSESLHEYVAKFLTLEQITHINNLKAPWLYSEQVEVRSYPNGEVAANIVGFVGTDEALAGVELMYDECLKGEDGYQIYERSADGVRVPGSTIIVEPSTVGEDIMLTLDADLQWFAQETLAEYGTDLRAEWGNIVILDASTGEILTAADWPTFNPNSFETYPSEVLGSKIFTTPYEPGSTIKSLSFALALESAAVTVDERFYIPEEYQINSTYSITDSFDHDVLQYTAAGVLVYSSNIGMSLIGERLTEQQVYETYTDFGLNRETEVGFIGESDGSVFQPENVDVVTQRTQLFGQGMTTTAMQIAGAYQALANNGIKLPISLISEPCGGDSQPVGEPRRVVSPTTANTVVEILEEVVDNGLLQSSVKTEGYELAAKTGTAEIATVDGYGDERIISIAGIVPSTNTDYVVLTTFVKPQTSRSSSSVGPAYNQIVQYLINKYDIPSTEDDIKLTLKW